MNIEEHDLNRLRQTILKHQLKKSYEIASMLFAKDVPRCTLLVASQMTRSYLRFRSRYDLDWIASFAQDVSDVTQEKHKELKFPDEANGTFADAPYGVTSLVSGAVKLWESISVAHEVNEKAKHLAEALNYFIIAELGNYWEAIHPEELQLRTMFWNAPTTVDGKKILLLMWTKKSCIEVFSFLNSLKVLGIIQPDC